MSPGGHEWNAAAADPVAAFLHAERVHLGLPPGEAEREREKYFRISAEGGFPRAANELGVLLKDRGTPPALAEAAGWFVRVIEASDDEADALYFALFNLGTLLLDGFEAPPPLRARLHNLGWLPCEHCDGGWADAPELALAVALFFAAAARGSQPASCNLGVAHLRGVGGVEQDRPAARVHFERCGTAQGTAVAAQIAEEMGDDDAAARLYRRAAALGYARASALENDAASRKTEL